MSEVKVNKISPRSGTTITLGDSGDTFTVPSGVTFDASSGGLAGTLTTAAQPNITSVGTLTSFTSTGIDDNATSTAITISSLGLVGIGTTSPNHKFELLGGSPSVSIKSDNTTNGSSNIIFGDTDDDDIGKIFYEHGTNSFRFLTNASERMRIDSSGNVGINNSSPIVPLEVNGFVKINEAPGVASGNLIIDSTATGNSQLRFYQGGTAKGYLTYWDSSDTLGLTDGSANGLHFSPSTQRVGIGTSSPNGILELKSTGNTNFFITAGNTSASQVVLGDTDDIDVGKITYSHNINSMEFIVNASERMRITSAGNILVGSTVNDSTDSNGQTIKGLVLSGNNGNGTYTYLRLLNRVENATTSNGVSIAFDHAVSASTKIPLARITASPESSTNGNLKFFTGSGSTLYERLRIDRSGRLRQVGTSNGNGAVNLVGEMVGTYKCLSFERTNSGGEVGSVVANVSSTSYNTSSDYRLKENVVEMTNATDRLKQLQPKRFNFINDADNTVDGFLAHEVSDVVPEAISGEKDAVDENGNPEYQGIDQSKLVPLLVKTIQELEARITTLENA